MSTPLEAKIDYFRGVVNVVPFLTCTLMEFLGDIQQGIYKRQIEPLRRLLATGHHEGYKKAKTALDAITPCGSFYPTRGKDHLLIHSGIVHGDLDHLDDLQAAKHLVCSDPHTVYCFDSPGGAGLKIGVHVEPVADDPAYKHAWQTVATYYQKYNVAWDESGKDISRLCFVSFDPDCYINPEAMPFPIPVMIIPPPRPQTSLHALPSSADQRQRYAQKALERATRMIDASTPGNLHFHRIRAAYLLGGYVAGGILDYEEAYATLATAVERNTSNLPKAIKDIVDCLEEGMHEPITLEALDLERRAWSRANGHAGPAAPPPPPHEAARVSVASTDPKLPWSDYTNALALVREHGADLRYCFLWKAWLVWVVTHWEKDTSGTVMRLAKATIKKLARQVEHLDEDAEIKALMAHIKSSLSTFKLRAMMESAQSELPLPVQPEDLDANPWLLNCQNGTLDLHTGTLRPHERGDLLTKCLPIEYAADAACPTWDKFLWRIMGGSQGDDSPDMSAGELDNRRQADARAGRLITFLQRAIGYSLTGDTREQCLFLLHGSGSNGKSTFLETLQALLGDYAQSTPSASLLAKKEEDPIRNDLARFRGARLITAVEIGEGKRLNEELVKRLTGQDTVTARFLYAEFFDFQATHKLFIACNHLPQIRGQDHAIWRRIRRIPFTVTIPEDKQDKDLPAKLRAELPGILRWAVQGCLDWQRDGLGTPEEVRAATEEYKASMDVLGQFIAECCAELADARCKASDLYEAYKKWCTNGGVLPVNSLEFGHKLTDRGFQPHKSNRIHWRLGIGLPSKEPVP